jgi:lysophospholipase L1-like esterase
MTMEDFPRRSFLFASLALAAFPARIVTAEREAVPDLEGARNLLSGSEPVTWLFTGDSITHGALHTHGFRSYPEHFAERVRWELGRVRDVVINTGISGDQVPGLLKDLDHRVLRFEPQVVSIMMGMNDATAGESGREGFRESYRTLIDTLREKTDSFLLLHTPNPITPAATSRADLPAYSQIVREVAEEKKTGLIDQEKLWNEYLSAKGRDLNYLLNDGTIHPNGVGHVLFAWNLFKELGIFDPDSRTCRLYVP